MPVFHLNGPSTVDNQFQTFMDQVSWTSEKQADICEKVKSDFTLTLQKAFTQFEVLCYGSMVNGLAFAGSDVDIRVVGE